MNHKCVKEDIKKPYITFNTVDGFCVYTKNINISVKIVPNNTLLYNVLFR